MQGLQSSLMILDRVISFKFQEGIAVMFLKP